MESLVAIVTNLCNLDCTHCLRDHNTVSISPKLFRSAVSQAKELGCREIRFTGGEAGLHLEFDELVEFVVEQGLRFAVMSNGYQYERYLPLLRHGKAFDRIGFSLDGAREETHDAMRGKGSYQRVVEGIRRFTAEGKKTGAQICITKRNKAEIEEVAALAEDLGLYKFRFIGVLPWSGGGTELLLDNSERWDCYERIERLKSGSKIKLRTMSSLMTRPGEAFCGGVVDPGCALTPEGRVSFCCDLPGHVPCLGSLEHESLKNLLRRAGMVADILRARRRLHLLNGEEYEGCDSCIFCIRSMKELRK